jgi:hypothetical protein
LKTTIDFLSKRTKLVWKLLCQHHHHHRSAIPICEQHMSNRALAVTLDVSARFAAEQDRARPFGVGFHWIGKSRTTKQFQDVPITAAIETIRLGRGRCLDSSGPVAVWKGGVSVHAMLQYEQAIGIITAEDKRRPQQLETPVVGRLSSTPRRLLQLQRHDQTQFLGYMRIRGLVWCAELLTDWIKHAFITKFNFLPTRVYPEYALLLAGGVTGIGHEGRSLNHSHAVVKRIGFAHIPLLCVMFRLLKEAAKFARHQTVSSSLHWRRLLLAFAARRMIVYVCVWVMLLILKLGLGRLLERILLGKLSIKLY